MNAHKHARLTFARRLEMVKELTEGGLSTTEAAVKHGVTVRTVRKWLGRYMAGGEAVLSTTRQGRPDLQKQSSLARHCSA